MSRPAGVGNRTAAVLVLAGAALAVAACGGNSPTAPPPRPVPPPPPPQVSFVAMGNPGTDAIGLGLSSATATEFSLTLSATGVTDLYGYGVDITFDPAVVTFAGAEPGAFLGGPGVNVNTQVVEGPDGTLIIGQTRVGNNPGISGDGALVTLNFISVVAGSTALTTANAGAFDSSGMAMTTTFFGGTATVPAQPRR